MIKRFLLLVFLTLLYLLLSQYLLSPRYHFQPPPAFSGSNYYNPYADVRFSQMYLANFHGHTKAWGGLTNGKGNADLVVQRYDSLGYDILNQSQYQSEEKMNPRLSRLEVYEHGYNMNKTHQLVIGSSSVVWSDYLLPQTLDQKQDILNTLAADTNNIIVLNHPNLRHGYSAEELNVLQNYDFIEGLHPHTCGLAQWDTALTYGHPVFLMGNDDFHDIWKDRQLGNCLTVLFATDTSATALLRALRKGNTFAAQLHQPITADLAARAAKIRRLRSILAGFSIKEDSVSLTLNEAASIRWIGIHGAIKKQEAGKQGGYRFTTADPYIRAEIKTTDSIEIFLNPVFRTAAPGLASRQERSRQGISTNNYQLGAVWAGKWFVLLLFAAILWKGSFAPLQFWRGFRRAGTTT